MVLWVLGYGITINLLGFGLFGWDKSCASRGSRRVPEKRLLTVAALGGAPAMLLGRSMFRHKTRKQPFRTYLNVILCIQVLVAIGLLVVLTGGFDVLSLL